MPRFLWGNKSISKLAAPLAAGATTMTLEDGSTFPTVVSGSGDAAQLVLIDGPTGAVTEVIQVTAHAAGSNTFTILRAQEGTTARGWVAGDWASLQMTKLVFEQLGQRTDGNNTLPLTQGGTGAVNAAGARTNLDVYSKAETDALDDWIPWNDARVTSRITWAAGTQAANELFVKIGRNSLQIKGIMRRNFTAADRSLWTAVAIPAGFTARSQAFQAALMSSDTSVASQIQTYVSSSPSGAGTLSGTIAGSWVMFDVTIVFL